MNLKVKTVTVTLFATSLLAAANFSEAAQKVIFNADSFRYEQGTGAGFCKYKCEKISDKPVQTFTSSGWKIVSTSPKEVIAVNYSREGGFVAAGGGGYIPPYSLGCTCIGSQFVIEEAKAEQPNIQYGSDSELESWKQENNVLKQKIESLEKENADLKKKQSGKAKKK